jgi:hypothetical protein
MVYGSFDCTYDGRLQLAGLHERSRGRPEKASACCQKTKPLHDTSLKTCPTFVVILKMPLRHCSSSPSMVNLLSSPQLPKTLWRWLAATVCFVVISSWIGRLVIDGALTRTSWTRPLTYVRYGELDPPIQDWDTIRDEVRDAFLHAWTGYKTRAFPGDELRAVSGGSTNQCVNHPFLL